MNEAEWTVSESSEMARERREGFVLSKEFFWRAKTQTLAFVAFGALFCFAIFGAVASHGFGIDMVFLCLAGLSLGSIPLARHWEKR